MDILWFLIINSSITTITTMSNFKIGDKIYIEAEILKESEDKRSFLIKGIKESLEDKIYWIDKEFIQEKPIEFPEVDEEYEFSNDYETWTKATLVGFITVGAYDYQYIRPIQNPSPEELQFLELAEKFKNKYSIKPL